MVAGFMLTEMPRQCAINGHYKGVFSNEVLNCKVSGYASSPLLLPVFMPCCLPRCAKRASDRERESERERERESSIAAQMTNRYLFRQLTMFDNQEASAAAVET